MQESRFQRAEFMLLARDRVLVILMAESGLVHHKTVMVDEGFSQDELDRMARSLSDLLKGRTLQEVRDLLVTQMAEEKALYDRLLTQALRLGAQALAGEAEADIYVAGAARIADQPEFADVQRMKSLYAAFEEKSKLVILLSECLRGEGCRIFIGSEIPVRDIQDLSVVASPYGKPGQLVGVLGVLGPTRMDYGRTVALVEAAASLLTRSLSEQAA
jgi:heat-inducible transcriptional repressor